MALSGGRDGGVDGGVVFTGDVCGVHFARKAARWGLGLVGLEQHIDVTRFGQFAFHVGSQSLV